MMTVIWRLPIPFAGEDFPFPSALPSSFAGVDLRTPLAPQNRKQLRWTEFVLVVGSKQANGNKRTALEHHT